MEDEWERQRTQLGEQLAAAGERSAELEAQLTEATSSLKSDAQAQASARLQERLEFAEAEAEASQKQLEEVGELLQAKQSEAERIRAEAE